MNEILNYKVVKSAGYHPSGKLASIVFRSVDEINALVSFEASIEWTDVTTADDREINHKIECTDVKDYKFWINVYRNGTVKGSIRDKDLDFLLDIHGDNEEVVKRKLEAVYHAIQTV